MIARVLIAASMLSACTTTDHDAISWSPGVPSDPAVLAGDPVIYCGDTVAHPCPWLTFMTKLTIAGDTATWSDPSESFTEPLPIVETITVGSDGSLTFPERGDESGLRLVTVITPDGGDFTWDLDNVAGDTTFHLTRTP